MININENSKTIQPCEKAKRFFATERGAEIESQFWAGDDSLRYVVNALSQMSKKQLDVAELIFTRELQARVI
jgi:hypothetical protein